MLLTEFSLTEASSEQLTECTVDEAKTSEYLIDCYPNAMKGILWGLLVSTVFWGSVIGLLMLAF